jgi:methyl-accepting chemotaxis protein
MNFSEAIKEHASWRLRLSRCCQGTQNEAINAQILAKDNACDLGKWLYGAGRQYASDPKFRELINVHSVFHRAVAEIATLAQSGRRKEAEAFLNSNDSQYAKASVQVVGNLMKFRTQFGDRS